MRTLLLALLPALLFALPAQAQDAVVATIDSGDTAWLLVATAMVLLMTPGLAFFYAGMVRSKNAVTTLYQSMVAVALAGLVWIVAGYSLAFVGDQNGFIGTLDALFLKGVGQEASGTIPGLSFMAFQMMFAIITPALITGAFAERVRFSGWLVFLVLWSLVVYAPVAHWIWTPTGWLAKTGALDFAGGFVVHMTAGFSALVAAIVIGKRSDFGTAHKPHNVGMIVLGTALLWFGWFGFNAGSALAANGLAAQALVNTFAASAVALLAWTFYDARTDGKATVMGGCIGAVAGLVAVTPAAGFVTVESALIIGLLAGILCNVVARMVKGRFGVDDSLDVFACHGFGGLLGILCTGLFATTAVNAAGADGMLNGGQALFAAQLTGAVAVAAYSMIATFIIIKVVDMFKPMRVTAADEAAGVDGSDHGEQITG